MKAVIMEIYKDYCIVMTGDGQFLKQNIPAGVFEIGDEIVVSKEYSYKPKAIRVSWLRSLSIAAMVVVVVSVMSIFGVWYLKQYRPLRDVTLLTEDATGEAAPAAVEEEAQEEKSTEESALTMEAEQGETVNFDKTYSLEEQTKVDDEKIGEIISFSYEIIDGVNIQVEFKNISGTSSFSGILKLTTLFSDGSASQTKTISLEKFEPAQVKEDSIFMKAGETNLRLEINGSAY